MQTCLNKPQKGKAELWNVEKLNLKREALDNTNLEIGIDFAFQMPHTIVK
jgi:hypothetical protein